MAGRISLDSVVPVVKQLGFEVMALVVLWCAACWGSNPSNSTFSWVSTRPSSLDFGTCTWCWQCTGSTSGNNPFNSVACLPQLWCWPRGMPEGAAVRACMWAAMCGQRTSLTDSFISGCTASIWCCCVPAAWHGAVTLLGHMTLTRRSSIEASSHILTCIVRFSTCTCKADTAHVRAADAPGPACLVFWGRVLGLAAGSCRPRSLGLRHLNLAGTSAAMAAGDVQSLLETYDRERRVLPAPVLPWKWGWTRSAEIVNGRWGAWAVDQPEKHSARCASLFCPSRAVCVAFLLQAKC